MGLMGDAYCSECGSHFLQSHKPGCSMDGLSSGDPWQDEPNDYAKGQIIRERECPPLADGCDNCLLCGDPAPDGQKRPQLDASVDSSVQTKPAPVIDEPIASEPVNVPLSIQEELFRAGATNAVSAVVGLLYRDRDAIYDLALERLRQGYRIYGSAMFSWQPGRRRQEIREELADSIVYLISGEIE